MSELEQSDEPYIANKMVSVVIPNGHKPGDSMNIQTDDGRVFAITIPAGVYAGQALTVEIVDDEHGGSAVVLADPKAKSSSSVHVGAAAVGGVLGMLLIGPVTGVVVAGAALYASTRDDGIGKATRATGGVAVKAFDKTAEVCGKYGVKEKLVAAGKVTYNKAAEINNEYNISGKASKLVSSGARAASNTFSAVAGSGSGGSSSAATTATGYPR